jgi:peptidoglycan/LPS O-acetylase OafA/YrhL
LDALWSLLVEEHFCIGLGFLVFTLDRRTPEKNVRRFMLLQKFEEAG